MKRSLFEPRNLDVLGIPFCTFILVTAIGLDDSGDCSKPVMMTCIGSVIADVAAVGWLSEEELWFELRGATVAASSVLFCIPKFDAPYITKMAAIIVPMRIIKFSGLFKISFVRKGIISEIKFT